MKLLPPLFGFVVHHHCSGIREMRGIRPATVSRGLRLARSISSASASARPAPSSTASSSQTSSASGSSPDQPKQLPRRTPGAPINSPVSAGGPGENAAYCASLVRRLDPDAWLTSYFWPRREREWWLAIRAFNVSQRKAGWLL